MAVEVKTTSTTKATCVLSGEEVQTILSEFVAGEAAANLVSLSYGVSKGTFSWKWNMEEDTVAGVEIEVELVPIEHHG